MCKIEGKDRVTCNLKHKLSMITGPIYSINGRIDCDSCSIKFIEFKKYYWNCYECKFTICRKCFIKAFSNSGKTYQEIREIKK